MQIIAVLFAFIGALLIAVLVAAEVRPWVYLVASIPFSLWCLVAISIESERQRDRLSAYARFLPVPYRATLDKVLKGLPRLLLPKSAE